jgi:protoporphyrinogen oxidase
MTISEIIDDRELVRIPPAVDILIIGAGPTGMGAATRLEQLGKHNWLLVDQFHQAGGLSRTDMTPEGFLFDMGGHVIFSHYDYFDELLNAAVGRTDNDWTWHERVSYVWIRDRWVPYPFQNNLFCLPAEDKIRCVEGVIDSALHPVSNKPRTFDEWILATMGLGIADIFMRPYNFKVWGYHPRDMQCSWLGERVATVDLKKVVSNIINDEPDAGWGPNAKFRFPKVGGTGSVWEQVSRLLPPQRRVYNRRLVEIETKNQIAVFDDGSVCRFKKMITTAPLDITLRWCGREDLASHLKYSSTHIIGIGLRGMSPHEKKCWMYFPEDNCPFYRCTVFSLYSPNNCPSSEICLPTLRMADGTGIEDQSLKPGPYWSLMFEVSETCEKPVDQNSIIGETIRGAINTKLIDPNNEIVSVFHHRLERGYPTPSLDRDKGVVEGLKFLKDMNIWSRGRFGAWKYEVGNQDHSCMQGVEAVDNIHFGTPELTLQYPNIVNSQVNRDLHYSHSFKQ